MPLQMLHQLFVTFVSKTFPGDAFLQTATQLNLYSIISLGPIVHQQEVGVVVIEAGESTLALDVQLIMGWETTLQTRKKGKGEREAGKTR